MSLAAGALKPNGFVIESLDGSKTVDLAGSSSIMFLDYFEDILSPSITMTVQVMNSTSLVNLLPIRGGEKVFLSIDTGFGKFEFDGENSLYVYKVSGISPDSTSEMFTLNLVSREALTNETVRCVKRYEGTIDQSITSILDDVLKTSKYKSENIEKTLNKYAFIGNQKKPFYIMTWLGPKSIPTSSKSSGVSGSGLNAEGRGVAGFLFYENKDGFNFRSVDSLVKNTRVQSGSSNSESIQKYYYTQITEHNKPINDYKILNYNFEKNNNLLTNLRVGMYSNKTYFYDLYKNKLSIYKYTLKEEIKNANVLTGDATIAVSEEFGESVSRIMVRTSDLGVMDNTVGGNAKVEDTTNMRDEADMAKSFSRYNLLFTQALNMVVPCNVTLKAGDIIYAEFPKIDRSDKKEADPEQSGNYLIKELRHHMEPGQMVTSLRLIRDSYGLYNSNNVNY